MRDLQTDLELCKKATPGPWKNIQDEDPNDVRVCQIENNICICCLALMGNYDYEKGEWFKEDEEQWENDANFIAAAREGWPETIKRAIKAEEQVAVLKEGLEKIKVTIEEYHPHNTLALPKFRFAKELHDIAIQALKELEVQP